MHNGIIDNASELKKELSEKHNIQFASETDTEVIAQLVGLLMSKGKSLHNAGM